MEFHLEGAGNPEGLAAVKAAAHLVRVSDALVPHGIVLEAALGGTELQVQRGKALIHAESGAVLNRHEVLTGGVVFTGEAVDATESQERLEFQRYLGGRFHQLVLDHQLVLVRIEYEAFTENNLPDLVGNHRDGICVKVHDVLVTAGFIDVSVAVDAQVETLTAQGKAFVQGAEQQMAVSVEGLHGYGQQTVRTAGVAGHDGRTAERAGLVRH